MIQHDTLEDFKQQEKMISQLEESPTTDMVDPDEERNEMLQNSNKLDMFNADMEGDPSQEEDDDDNQEQQPLLFVDINLGGDEQERIVVFEGDTAENLAHQFCVEHNLDDETKVKLEELLKQQMASVLPKIDENEYYSDEEGSNK